MNKTDWLLLLTVVIPVIPAVLKELRLWWEYRRRSACKTASDKGD